jgi:hypothetical protein
MLVKIVLGLLWIPFALIILLITSYIKYSSSIFWIFYAQTLILTLIIFTIISVPYFLMLKKYSWVIIIFIIGLSIFSMFTTKISYFFPPIPVYQGAQNVTYASVNLNYSEFPSNRMLMGFEIPNGTDVKVMKNVAMFYKQVFARRGYKLVGSYPNFSECSDHFEKRSSLGDEAIGCAIVDSSNGIQLRLIFNKNFVSIFVD